MLISKVGDFFYGNFINILQERQSLDISNVLLALVWIDVFRLMEPVEKLSLAMEQPVPLTISSRTFIVNVVTFTKKIFCEFIGKSICGLLYQSNRSLLKMYQQVTADNNQVITYKRFLILTYFFVLTSFLYHAFTAEVIQLLLNYELQASNDLIEVTVLSLFQDTRITQYETTDYYCIKWDILCKQKETS